LLDRHVLSEGRPVIVRLPIGHVRTTSFEMAIANRGGDRAGSTRGNRGVPAPDASSHVRSFYWARRLARFGARNTSRAVSPMRALL
jgi:hypothetical protein